MFEPTSIAIPRLSSDDLHGFRQLVRADRSFDARFAKAMRLGFFALVQSGGCDPEARLGLRLAADEAMLALAGTPAQTHRQVVRKRSLLRSWVDQASPEAMRATIMTHAIDAEGKRLELFQPICHVREAAR